MRRRSGAVGLRVGRCCCRSEGCEVTVAALPADLLRRRPPVPPPARPRRRRGARPRRRASRRTTPSSRRRSTARTIVLAAGPAGVRGAARATSGASIDAIEVLADFNAAEPLGIEGTEATDDFEDYDGKLVLGALAIGGPKMKVHKTCIRRLFETQRRRSSTSTRVYEIAKELVLSPRGPRVAGIDPGTVSFDVCALDGGEAAARAQLPHRRRWAPTPRRWSTRCSRPRPVRARARPGRLRAAARARRRRSASASSR